MFEPNPIGQNTVRTRVLSLKPGWGILGGHGIRRCLIITRIRLECLYGYAVRVGYGERTGQYLQAWRLFSRGCNRIWRPFVLDFSSMKGGVRGKYAQRFCAGTNLVKIDPDVAEVFMDDTAVNEALRELIKVARRQVTLAH